MDETGNESVGNVSLPAVVDLPHAGVLKAQLERGLASGSGITIDGSAVQRISSPCLQVLVAGMTAFTKAGGPPMTIVKPSAAFLETVSVLGLGDVLGLVGAQA
jgi:anti-anti-sigma regulatory factor